MPSYLLLYRGPSGDAMSAPPDQQKAVMDAWNAYFGKHGSAIRDGGNPTMPGTNVKAGDDAGTAADITGYSIVEAADIPGARAMLKDHLHLIDSRNSIDVLEIVKLPTM